MKVCFDVNTVIHLFAQTEKLGDSVFAYDIANIRGFEVVVPASSLADIAYILRRRGLNAKRVADAMDMLFELFDVIDVNGSDGRLALGNEMRDYEDALIAQACERNGVDLILTHNIADFAQSPVAAMAPSEFVNAYKPTGYDYADFEL